MVKQVLQILNIFFASNHIFGGEMGWGKGHLAQEGSKPSGTSSVKGFLVPPEPDFQGTGQVHQLEVKTSGITVIPGPQKEIQCPKDLKCSVLNQCNGWVCWAAAELGASVGRARGHCRRNLAATRLNPLCQLLLHALLVKVVNWVKKGTKMSKVDLCFSSNKIAK